MNTTDTRFDRLAELTQEAVDALKQAIERAEAAEAKCTQLRKQRDLFWSQRDEFRDEVEQLKRELSKAWYNRYRTPKIEVVQTETSRLHDEVIELRRHLGKTMSERDSNKELYDAWYRKHLRKLEAVKAERDALQARIDAGVRVWGKDLGNGEWCWSYTEYHTIDTHTAILIDPKPIADHVPDAGKMMDDDRKGEADSKRPDRRTGERRVEGSWEYCSCHQLLEPSCHKNMDYCWRPTSGDGVFAQDNRRDPSGANDRRKGKA